MSVGVAQNAVDNRLATMCEPGAKGRSFHRGATVGEPDAVLHGYNAAEQWERALQEDPRFVFVTGWNEWFAGRFDEFLGVRLPVMFVDQFDQEHSRDIEPMQGGHGDNYYYQMVSYIRRYKGARPLTPVTSQPIQIDGRFDDWAAVGRSFATRSATRCGAIIAGYGQRRAVCQHDGPQRHRGRQGELGSETRCSSTSARSKPLTPRIRSELDAAVSRCRQKRVHRLAGLRLRRQSRAGQGRDGHAGTESRRIYVGWRRRRRRTAARATSWSSPSLVQP